MTRILIVRMSALGDIVHALPVLAAVRAAYPDAEVDWLVDRAYAGVLAHVSGVTQVIVGRPQLTKAVSTLRARSYDAAVDLQGLLKSAVMARLSGASRVIGFGRPALREPAAAWFYSEEVPAPDGGHVIQKNLSILPALGVLIPSSPSFPFVVPASAVAATIADETRARGYERYALINPGAAWPNKRWAPERFGAVARHLLERHRLPSWVLWGPGEQPLADAVVEASGGAATRAPETSIGDLLAITVGAALMISGDTGPVHLAAAMGTPIVGLYGPTWPERNGPWAPDDVVVSRASECACHHKRRCQRARWCLDDISIGEVIVAADQRLARATGGAA